MVVGEKEREKYKDGLNQDKFDELGQKVFEYGGTRIYKIS